MTRERDTYPSGNRDQLFSCEGQPIRCMLSDDSYFLRRSPMFRVALLILLGFAPAVHAQETVAFFGIHLIDSSMPSPTSDEAAEQARVAMLEAMVSERFQEEGYVFVDLSPVQRELDGVVNPAKCYGCDARMAVKLGADYALVGEVQKTSNLILAINLQLRDAQTGETIRGRVVDIRGNTDDSWIRGMRYILKTAFFD